MCFDNLSGSHLQRHVNCGSSVDGIHMSDCCCHFHCCLAMMLLAVETQVSDWCVSIRVLLV